MAQLRVVNNMVPQRLSSLAADVLATRTQQLSLHGPM